MSSDLFERVESQVVILKLVKEIHGESRDSCRRDQEFQNDTGVRSDDDGVMTKPPGMFTDKDDTHTEETERGQGPRGGKHV